MLAEKRGWFVLFPTGLVGDIWWDEVGMANITALIRRIKTKFNVDDDRVYIGGFSDGGSAGYLYAMTMPTDFAAFFVLNGHMGIGSEDGSLPIYATNLFNSPIFVTTTNKDQHYLTSQMERTITMATRSGAKIFYRPLEGGHDFNDIKGELPAIFDFFEQHPRISFSDTIIWETAKDEFGRCRWLAIDDVTIDDPAPWYVDYNIALVDSSITLGIVTADTFFGYGAMIDSIIGGSFAEQRLSLERGDIITMANDNNISNVNDLTQFESSLKHGDRVSLLFKRGFNGLGVISRIPLPRKYLLFKRELPSAVVKATYRDNWFDIQGSRLGAFRIMIHPEMVDLSKNVVVVLNGEKIFNDRVMPDIAYMLHCFLANRDKELLFVNELSLRPTK
jgi:hypothetical protein